jgi:hypothetical protein
LFLSKNRKDLSGLGLFRQNGCVQRRVALGIRAHSGWAAVVAVSGSADAPTVLARRRITIATAIRQPYHAAEPLPLDEAEALIRNCREEAAAVAIAAAEEMRRTHGAKSAAILVGRPRALPELAAILRSHAAIHTAEGIFYREIWIEACHQAGLRVTRVVEPNVKDRVAALPKLPPPWTADEKLATAAALLSLSRSGAASSGS